MPTYICINLIAASWVSQIWMGLHDLCPHQEKEEKLDGDAALNKFFRDIYKDADEDMRRAMMKSFVRDLCPS